MKINSINKEEREKTKNKNKYQYKNQDKDKCGEEDEELGNAECAAQCGDQFESGLYSVDQPGSRLKTRARAKVKFFENLVWLDANEAAEYLRLPSVGVLRVLVCQRKVPFHKLGRRLRFKKMELDRLVEASTYGGI